MARHWAFEPSTWYHYLPVPLGKSLQLSCGKSQSGTPSPQKRSVKASWMVSRCFSYKSASSFGILNSIAFPGSVKICWQCSCGWFHPMITYHDYSNNKRIMTTSTRVLAIHIYHHHGKQKLTFGPISNGTLSYPSRLCPGGSLQWSKCHGCTSHPPTAGLPGSDWFRYWSPSKEESSAFQKTCLSEMGTEG